MLPRKFSLILLFSINRNKIIRIKNGVFLHFLLFLMTALKNVKILNVIINNYA